MRSIEELKCRIMSILLVKFPRGCIMPTTTAAQIKGAVTNNTINMDGVMLGEIPDIYADELDRVEICGGGNVRLVYVTYRHGIKHVVANLIRPMHTLQALDINCNRLKSLLQQAKAHHVGLPELH
jgi:hypothetical protein